MGNNVVSDITSFEEKFPNTPKDGDRKAALEQYFKVGGVVKVFKSEKEWPTLTYPNTFVIDRKLKELKQKKDLYQRNLTDWTKKYKAAENYHKSNQVKKLKEPLYWKHKAKMLVDPDYRKDVATVSLPVHLVSDNKWKPMVKMFVTDLDYRKQLSETVRESIVYKKDRKVAKYADELKDFRMNTSGKQMKDLDKKISKINEVEFALKELHKWSKE
jgi:hypothetical protein